ncbi:MAG: biopolymer transporter ExbD [Sphingobacteriales bacterium]|nr:biopolymer transporter ExbD [Sphingobacteriales bacterium]OJY91087.1 MAG: biopolymer transporter ExbD [Sphingobacteriales bacterium 44-15]
MNIRKRLRDHAEVHTGALNDILFILLLFFLIVSTLANPNVIKVSAPKGKSDTKAKQTVVVSIDKNNQVYIGQKKTTLNDLEKELQAVLSKENEKPSVVVNADTAGHWGDVYKVLQTAKKLGATAVASVDAN